MLQEIELSYAIFINKKKTEHSTRPISFPHPKKKREENNKLNLIIQMQYYHKFVYMFYKEEI